MRPASTQKILTAVSALDLLGKNHFYRTRTYYDGTIQQVQQKIPNPSKEIDPTLPDSIVQRKRVLRGNIYVVGDFDPLVSYSDLKDIARAVRELGIDSIDGRIVGDVSMKDADQLGNGWCWDDVPSRLIPYLSPQQVHPSPRGVFRADSRIRNTCRWRGSSFVLHSHHLLALSSHSSASHYQ